MLRRLLFLLPVFLALFTGTTLHAQTVRWEPGAGTLALNQTSALSLVFEQCEPTAPRVPAFGPDAIPLLDPQRNQGSVLRLQTAPTKHLFSL